MSLAIGFDEAKANQTKSEGMVGTKGAVLLTPFFRFRDNADMPHASLSQREPGRYSCAHFHRSDQFQVVVDGKGKLGRHDLTPYNVHFARAYTPYGPLISDADTGLTFFVMRAHFDAGSQRLPMELDQLRRAANRQPWQIKRQVSLPMLQSDTGTVDLRLQEVPGIKDDHGLAAYALSMSPNGQGLAPDPSQGDGQYLVVVKGSLLHDGKEHKAPALVFVFPTDGPFEMHSGPQGLGALVLNFPRVKSDVVHGKSHSTFGGLKKWQCALCNFAYDEEKGMPDEGIPAGTSWEDVPETWSCPDCGASKSDFQITEA